MDTRPNQLTINEASCILDALPNPRRKTYLDIAAQHESFDMEINVLAARLYIWNGDLASTVDRAVSEVEIQLRNCIDRAFSEWNSEAPRNGSREWLLHPEGELAEVTLKDGKPLADRSDVRTVSGTPLHDDYVAGLTFGQWVHLLPKPYARENNARIILWREALQPHLATTNRVVFQQQAMSVKELRNRATHRRPLIKDINSINDAHRNCIELLRAINPDLGEWFKAQKWIPSVLAESPLRKA